MSKQAVSARVAVADRRGVVIAAAFTLALALVSFLVLSVAARPAHAVGKGIADWRLEMPEGISDLSVVDGIVREIGPANLNASWTRVYFRWQRLQPTAPGVSNPALDANGYDAAYVKELDTVIGAFKAQGVRVILTGIDVPEWASDKRYWVDHTFDPDVVMKIGDPVVRTAWQNLARFLASRYKGKGAEHFEVWNEPNLGSGIYPQLVGKKKTPVGPSVYLKMLKAFSAGAKQGNAKAVVIAGATSRRGANDVHSTSPQWFAAYLKSHGAAKYFRAYSHHPYTAPGSRPSPTAKPARPKNMVTLGNISVLLKMFPKTPFYLTEYGYSTGKKDLFCVTVSPSDQARYLRQAYALMARRPQVKAMLWFLVKDYQPDAADPANGIYSGLIGTDDVRKPAWYAFAGGNKLSAGAPASSPAGATFSITGALQTKLGPRAGVTLVLQSRRLTGTAWSRVATTTTATGGAYAFSVKQTGARVYRVMWDGVCESSSRRVLAQ